MFKTQIQRQLKAEALILLSSKIENKIMPPLQLQKGFCDAVTFVTTERTSVSEATFGNTQAVVEEYQKKRFLMVLEMHSEVVVESPIVSISRFSNQKWRSQNG